MKCALNDGDLYRHSDRRICKGCVFRQETPAYETWPCDLIPGVKCAGLDIYVQTDELEDIFIYENLVK